MSADRRKVSTDALETLGMKIDEYERRDAIHLGVEPCVAGEDLKPGEHIGIIEGAAFRKKITNNVKLLGIVDPFLNENLNVGDRFWLIVYPRQITSLRHVWTHPDFYDEDIEEITKNGELSIKWMKDWAWRHMSDDHYEDGTVSKEQAYANAIYAGYNNHVKSYEEASNYINDEWWNHWETITGCKGDREAYFNCSC